ncbi:hypothetical protein KCU78_g5961, partial [Aureobasidium melanogenum]
LRTTDSLPFRPLLAPCSPLRTATDSIMPNQDLAGMSEASGYAGSDARTRNSLLNVLRRRDTTYNGTLHDLAASASYDWGKKVTYPNGGPDDDKEDIAICERCAIYMAQFTEIPCERSHNKCWRCVKGHDKCVMLRREVVPLFNQVCAAREALLNSLSDDPEAVEDHHRLAREFDRVNLEFVSRLSTAQHSQETIVGGTPIRRSTAAASSPAGSVGSLSLANITQNEAARHRLATEDLAAQTRRLADAQELIQLDLQDINASTMTMSDNSNQLRQIAVGLFQVQANSAAHQLRIARALEARNEHDGIAPAEDEEDPADEDMGEDGEGA